MSEDLNILAKLLEESEVGTAPEARNEQTRADWLKVAEIAREFLCAWRPIESAPMDGTKVIYFNTKLGERVGNHPPGCARGRWSFNETTNQWSGSAHFRSELDTHWQPLPEPPREVGK